MPGLAEQASTAASTVGRYFSVVSSLPSLLFAAYVFILVRSGAWSGPVNLAGIVKEDWWENAIVVGILAFVGAVVLHPLQFQLIRLLEGYWGTSTVGRTLAVLRIRHHRRRLMSLRVATELAGNQVARAESSGRGLNSAAATDATIFAAVMEAEGARELAGYPALESVLPTRLGNALRRDERLSGRAYGLDAITTFPRIALIAPPTQLEYTQDQRLQMELAVRVAFLGLLATTVTVAFMWWHGWWNLLAIVPYGFAYLSYRGAVVLAGIYGTAVASMIDLNRFALYEQLHLEHPSDSDTEFQVNAELLKALRRDPSFWMAYQPPPTPAGPPAPGT